MTRGEHEAWQYYYGAALAGLLAACRHLNAETADAAALMATQALRADKEANPAEWKTDTLGRRQRGSRTCWPTAKAYAHFGRTS